MTELKLKKLLTQVGLPEEAIAKELELLKAEGDDYTPSPEIMKYAKATLLPVIKSEIEPELRRGAVAGTVEKTLRTLYNQHYKNKSGATSFDDWKKTVEGRDYAELMEEAYTESRTAGASKEEAVKELTDKITTLQDKLKEKEKEVESVKTDYETKISERDRKDKMKEGFSGLKDKAINQDAAQRLFEIEESDKGVEYRLHQGVIKPFKKGEETPMLGGSGTAFETLETRWTEFKNNNSYLFQQSPGGAGSGPSDPTLEKVEVKDGNIVKPGHRPIPV